MSEMFLRDALGPRAVGVPGLGKRGSGLNSTVKQVLIWVLMVGCMIMAWRYFSKNFEPTNDKPVTMTEFMNFAAQGKLGEATINGTDVSGKSKDGKDRYHTTIPANYPDFYNAMNSHGVNLTIKDTQNNLCARRRSSSGWAAAFPRAC